MPPPPLPLRARALALAGWPNDRKRMRIAALLGGAALLVLLACAGSLLTLAQKGYFAGKVYDRREFEGRFAGARPQTVEAALGQPASKEDVGCYEPFIGSADGYYRHTQRQILAAPECELWTYERVTKQGRKVDRHARLTFERGRVKWITYD